VSHLLRPVNCKDEAQVVSILNNPGVLYLVQENPLDITFMTKTINFEVISLRGG